MLESVSEKDLPPQIRELIALIGAQATLELVAHCGGTSVIVPKHYRHDHWLVAVIGAPAAEQVIQRFGGAVLYVAKLDEALRAARDREIVERYGKGEPVKRLARYYRLTERQVWNILTKTESSQDDRQIPLL